jgi:membrane-associated PAP2 superfamily phosphatase
MMIPSWLTAFFLALGLSAFINAVIQTCAVHQCPWIVASFAALAQW